MKADTKKAVDFPSRAARLAAETGGAARSDRARIVVKKRPRLRLPSTLEGSAALSYADIGFFFVSVFFLAMIFRIGVRLHVLNQTRLDNPTFPFQVAISLSLIGLLYAIIRLRHGRDVWTLLGWVGPGRIHLVTRLVGRDRAWSWGRHHCSCDDSNHSRDPHVELDSPRRVAWTNH